MIDIQDLHFAYKKKKVFTGLNLSLQPGHIYGLLGKNGTGKSTLLRNIAGLLFPDQGKVKVLNYNPGQRKPAFLQELFMVPEEFYLPNVSIERRIAGVVGCVAQQLPHRPLHHDRTGRAVLCLGLLHRRAAGARGDSALRQAGGRRPGRASWTGRALVVARTHR